MTDAITISSGGAVAVDTAALDAAALVLDAAATDLAAAAGQLRVCAGRLSSLAVVFLSVQGDAEQEAATAEAAMRDAEELASGLRAASATYALVELRIARDVAATAGDETGAAAAQRGIDELEARYPDAVAAADAALAEASATGSGPVAQAAFAGLVLMPFGINVLGLVALAVGGIRASGLGTVPSGRGIAPGGTAGTLRPLPIATPATAPRTLADAAARIPSSGDGRVRVEQYTRADGSRSFAVYITGTRSLAGRDPWDMASNLDSFAGRRSDALATVEAALRDAGAQPGDAVYAFGHSQGGMLAGQLEQAGVYDVQMVGTFGSPTALDAGDDTFSAQVRHRDDPVAALAVGHADRAGSENSFVVERTVDEAPGLHDLTLPGHHLDTYVATAEAADASADPRVAALHRELDALADSELVDVRLYGAERVVAERTSVLAPGSGASTYPQFSARGRD
jgi:hypothetical protein